MVKRAGKMLTVIGVLLLFLVYLFPRLAGFRVYSVISGSMEPGIPVGSLVYARKTEPEKLKEGEIIVYSRGREKNSCLPKGMLMKRQTPCRFPMEKFRGRWCFSFRFSAIRESG